MQKLHFEIEINAPALKVWDVLWSDKTYREWTRAFGESGYAVSDWKEGSSIHFLSGKGDGMNSRIEKLIPASVMSFKHLGFVKDGVEQPETEESKKWSGIMEEYFLTEHHGKTTLKCDMDMEDGHADFFNEAFPVAFSNIKEIAERTE